MKRSEVNTILADAAEFIGSFGFRLPAFATLSPADWRERRAELAELVERRLGWDITDYGKGDFARVGLTLFTLRNGNPADLARGSGMLYAEKIMISRKGQLAPMHRHVVKAEDIINRGGGALALKLYASAEDGGLDRSRSFAVACDGVRRTFEPGGILRLAPGESVTLLSGIWHAFWAEEGDVLIGEVSTVNDDLTDNLFAEPVSRFSSIDEDAPPARLLVSDYDRWLA